MVLQSGRRWTQMVLAEHEQSERAMADLPPKDFWSGLSHRFVPPRPGEGGRDETLEALLAVVRPEHTVMDVGAGAGRLAMPLSRNCRSVTAVEPSEAMRGRLAEMVKVWEVSNLRVIPDRWEDASPDPADIVFCAHVVYTVTDIELFTAKLDKHARELVAVILFEKPAAANYFPLWAKVHGEERLALPSAPEYTGVLTEMGVEFQVQRLPPWGPEPFADMETAVNECSARLFVEPGSEKSDRLKAVLRESLTEVDGGLGFHWAAPSTPWLITWAPHQAGNSSPRAEIVDHDQQEYRGRGPRRRAVGRHRGSRPRVY